MNVIFNYNVLKDSHKNDERLITHLEDLYQKEIAINQNNTRLEVDNVCCGYNFKELFEECYATFNNEGKLKNLGFIFRNEQGRLMFRILFDDKISFVTVEKGRSITDTEHEILAKLYSNINFN